MNPWVIFGGGIYLLILSAISVSNSKEEFFFGLAGLCLIFLGTAIMVEKLKK